MTPRRWVVDPILQRPLRVRERLGTTPEPHALADVVSPLFAPIALLARQADFQRDLVADAETLDIGADADDNACRLVAQRQRLLHQDVAIAVVAVVVQV
jgi:hypothetical protein